jgi:glucose/arabinose dehydrogenase
MTLTSTQSPSASPSPSPRTFEPLATVALTEIPAAEQGLPSLTPDKVTSGNYPAGLSIAPDGRVFFTELFGGHINVVDERGQTTMWYDVNAYFHINWTQFYHGGLTAITVDPEFATNHYVFAVTQVPNAKTGFAEKSLILRFTERNGRGTAPKVRLTIPAEKFDDIYSLVFAPDGTIFIPSGHDARQGVADVPGDLVG